MSFGHSWFDVLHDENMSIGTDLSTVSHEFDFFFSLGNFNFIDDVVKSSLVQNEVTEPFEFWGEWSFSRIRIDSFSIDVDDRWVLLLYEVL